ncbi:MAG: hypothetical protein ACR2IM_02860, partial [Sediminibacterium sp.]
FKLAKGHNEPAQIIRNQIKLDKENLFQDLKSAQADDSVRNTKNIKSEYVYTITCHYYFRAI